MPGDCMEKNKPNRLRSRSNKFTHCLKIKKKFKKNQGVFESASNKLFAIIGQDLTNGKTIFIIKHLYEKEEQKRSAYELYQDTSILKQFNFNDLLLILSTAVQEQTIEDMQE